jgi:hypothetical protein
VAAAGAAVGVLAQPPRAAARVARSIATARGRWRRAASIIVMLRFPLVVRDGDGAVPASAASQVFIIKH